MSSSSVFTPQVIPCYTHTKWRSYREYSLGAYVTSLQPICISLCDRVKARLDAVEKKGLGKILRVSWTAIKTNEWLLSKVE